MPRIQHKRGTSANLASVNPTPLAGELVWDSTENAIKIGDGSTAWTSLAYVTATPRSHNHDDRYYTETEVDNLLAGKAASSHTHTFSQISDITFPFPLADNSIVVYTAGVGWGVASAIGTIGVGSQPLGGWPAGSVGASLAGKVDTSDSRLTDARTPTAHKASHATGGSDALTPADIGAAPAASPTFTGNINFSDGVIITRTNGPYVLLRHAGTDVGQVRATTGIVGITNAAASAFQLSVHTASGNVGIGTGTTSPASRLDVNGVITVSATSGSNGTYAASVCFSSDPDTGLGQVGGTNTCSLIGGGFEVLRATNASISVFRPLNHRFLNLQRTSNYDICGDFSGFSFFYGTTSATSKPPGTDHAVTTLSFSTEWQFQDAADWRTNARYVRGQQAGVWSAWSRLYADNYHPEADKWTTARTLTLTGAISGSVSIDGSGNVSLATSFTNPITETYVNVGTTGTAKTIALTSGTVQNFTLTGNCTFTMPTATAGQSFTLMLRTGAGSYTATFTGVKWPGSTPVVTTTASRMDLFTFVSDGTNWYGNVVQGYTP